MILPEIVLLSGGIFILLIDLFLKGEKALTFYLTALLLLVVLGLMIRDWNASIHMMFAGQYITDNFAVLLKGFMVALSLLILIYTRPRAECAKLQSESIFLMIFSLLGGMVLVSAASLITLYLGLELLSLPLYVLVALKRDSALGGEAAIKYFVMGALASGFLLYGFSLLYGLTGTLGLPQMSSNLLYSSIMGTPAFYVAAILIMVAIAFKLGLVPFHLWVADVYEGAPLSVTIFLTSVPKIAILALFLRLFAETFTAFIFAIQPLFFILGMISLFVGSSVALLQKNLRRFLGYSTIANMGIVFIALGIGSPQGFASGVFYTLSYAATSVAFFGLLLMFKRDFITLDDLKGLHQQKPFTAFLFLILMLSFAGIPPLLGFDAKFLVILSLVHVGNTGLAIAMLVLSILSAAYALRVIKAIYFERAEGDFSMCHSPVRIFIILNTLAILGFGIFPSGLMNAVNHVFM